MEIKKPVSKKKIDKKEIDKLLSKLDSKRQDYAVAVSHSAAVGNA